MGLPNSADEIVLLHNPRCSKSRATLALLEENGADFVVREYLGDPLSVQELADLRGRLDRPVAEWLRPKEEPFVASGVARVPSLTSAGSPGPYRPRTKVTKLTITSRTGNHRTLRTINVVISPFDKSRGFE